MRLTASGEFSWLRELHQKLLSCDDKDRIVIVADNDNLSGIVGLVNCLRQEPGGQNIRYVLLR